MIEKPTTLFNSSRDDFFKIYFPTLLVFLLILANQFLFPNFALEKNVIYFFIVAFFIDAGHVYTTFLESYTDTSEIKKHHTLYWTGLAFILNLGFLIFFSDLFFYYIFYFTIFHNMRQGLGVSFIYQKKLPIAPNIFKTLYYFGTMVPFILFHFKLRPKDMVGDHIIERLDLFQWFQSSTLDTIYFWGQLIYLVSAVLIILYLLHKKIETIIPFLFFMLVYAISFLLLNNEIYAYSLLITSHGIPYFFLIEKRIRLTHPKEFIKKHALFLLLIMASLGAMIDFLEDDIYDITDSNIYVQALFYTPLIAHFLIDGVIWKRGHEKFELLKKSFR